MLAKGVRELPCSIPREVDAVSWRVRPCTEPDPVTVRVRHIHLTCSPLERRRTLPDIDPAGGVALVQRVDIVNPDCEPSTRMPLAAFTELDLLIAGTYAAEVGGCPQCQDSSKPRISV
jgi:hypothetical protein